MPNSRIIPRRLLHIAVYITLLAGVLGNSGSKDEPLRWTRTSNAGALCNDFTRAGFFHRNATENGAKKWVVFLESGAVCYSNETCNRRYFNSAVRSRYSGNPHENSGYGDFDPSLALSEYGVCSKSVNPLMTSMECFNNTEYFPSGLQIEGRDIFDRSISHVFADHGQVIIPYCSSDVWLGNDSRVNFEGKSGNADTPCECFDTKCFEYSATATGLQFTFRGKVIFQSVMEDLDHTYNLTNASEIVLIGSSAGGVGVLNLAKWVTERFPEPSVKVITDSAWFINYRNGIHEQFLDSRNMASSQGSPTNSETSSSVSGSGETSSSVTTPSDTQMSPSTNIKTPSPTSEMSSSFKGPSATQMSPSSTHIPTSIPTTSDAFSSSIDPSTLQKTPYTTILPPTPTVTPSNTDMLSGSGESGDLSGSGNNFKRFADIEEEEEEKYRFRRNVNKTDDDLVSLLSSHDSCSDLRHGYPCCLSAHCVLSSNDSETNEPYFPSNVRLFVLTSLYDVFILGQSLQSVQMFQEDIDRNPVGPAIEYLTVVGEYGGVMDTTLSEIQSSGRVDLSYYLPQCFQHIYFATSSLWGEGGVYGTDAVQIGQDIGTFR